MLLKDTIRIENARLYPAEIVDQLRTELSNGAVLQPNEDRRNFYDLYTDGRTYFIYVSPSSGRITLIAIWERKLPSADVNSDEQVPWWRRIATNLRSV